MHVVMQKRDEIGRLNNLEAEIQGVRDAFEVAMAGRIQFHVLRETLHFFGGPRLIRQLAALYDSRLGFRAQEETAGVRKNRICSAAGPGLPTAFNIRLAVRGARRSIGILTESSRPQDCRAHRDTNERSHLVTGYGRANSKMSPSGLSR